MKKLIKYILPVMTFIFGLVLGAIGYFSYIDKIRHEYDRNFTSLHFESSLSLFWALAADKIELAKSIVAKDIKATQNKMIKNGETAIIPQNIDSLINISKDYKYTGTVFSTLPIKSSEEGEN